MAQPRSWLNEVIEVIQLLGGEAHYEDIYRLIYERQIINFENNPNWQAAVRQNIEMHSSDSAAYSGKKNIFYTVAGKGRGLGTPVLRMSVVTTMWFHWKCWIKSRNWADKVPDSCRMSS